MGSSLAPFFVAFHAAQVFQQACFSMCLQGQDALAPIFSIIIWPPQGQQVSFIQQKTAVKAYCFYRCFFDL